MSKTIYLDHSATTPLSAEAFEAMKPYWSDEFGNPSSLHHKGQQARSAVESARQRIADFLRADPKEIIFTSGGTEADNLAVFGTLNANKAKGNHIITSSIEHHAVLTTCQHLAKQGFEVTYVPVDKCGIVDVAELKKAIRKETILISVMHSNNEVGTLQPVAEIAQVAQSHGITFHTDAVQSLGKVKIDLSAPELQGVNLMSLSAHKIYGPKGIGILYIRKGTKITPVQYGGHHEFRRRAGTENVPGIIGFAKAIEIALADLEANSRKLSGLRDRLEKAVTSKIPDVQVNGHPTQRLPNILNASFKYVEGEGIILNLDSYGICVSSGSACTSESLEPSHVLSAMCIPPEVAHGSIRFSLGASNTEADMDFTADCLVKVIARLREMSPIAPKKTL
ncbi:MAG: cysteine desulfurase NifS [Planctomycetes bacterium]|nr:cysteine desulfurase NifS [Planctomycetota bacterium]